jgi:signal transduction histidine kinase
MRARAARLGAALVIKSTPAGTVIKLNVPISRPPTIPTTQL